MPSATDRNLLGDETSPYLLQHAENPVHWQPWTSEALALAARDNKPILLSIGYSACHWCHVMAHESFEDPETAALMNDGFVNIKVDREERPDLDQIYQLAHQMLTQRPGGWPLTMFLTSDGQVPFFGGTYFPAAARAGMPAFREVLQRVLAYHRDSAADIADQSATILDLFRRSDPAPPEDFTPGRQPLDAARQALLAEFDARFGGFGGAPKFPMPSSIERLLRHWHATSVTPEPDLQALFMATKTLHGMARGGLFDQLGGGFFRYCVDVDWQIPHFEKMLGDNALLLALYAQAFKATGERLYWRVASQTADWLERELRAPKGGFCAALDADSDGGEGAYYVFGREEVADTLGADAASFLRHYGFESPANFDGRWHLTVASAEDADEGAGEDLAAARARLFARRQTRTPPARDDKRLTAWNALTVCALAIAARHLNREDLAVTATETADFLREHLYADGRLLAVFADGRARFNGYLDDYAFLLDALLELLQTRFRRVDLDMSIALAETLLARFRDPVDGGFHFTSDDHETLLHRMKPFADAATPAGNGVAARALLRLGYLLGERRYLEAAEDTVAAAWDPIERVPHAHGTLLGALEEMLDPTLLVVIRAPRDELDVWRQAGASYAPRRLMFAIAEDEDDLPAALALRACRPGGVAYLCRGETCDAPLTSPQALSVALR